MQAHNRYQDRCKRESEAFSTLLRHISPDISPHLTRNKTSYDLWKDLDDRYRNAALATFCDVSAQLIETKSDMFSTGREYVDQIGLLVRRLNILRPNSVTDYMHISFLSNNIGPEYENTVNGIKNESKPDLTATDVANRVANASRNTAIKKDATQPQVNHIKKGKNKKICKHKGHKPSECWILHPRLRPQNWQGTPATGKRNGSSDQGKATQQGQQKERQAVPAGFQETTV
ncbi:hypothetical protein VTN31DRAFT_6752 [Thermomyces dupontii]|uniref:uncharacterized protein n=1 Tax=Talaromyces thermophilus TaxID=28565 RepID=UPI00374212C1